MRTCPRHQTSLFFSFYTIVPHSIKKQYFFINRKIKRVFSENFLSLFLIFLNKHSRAYAKVTKKWELKLPFFLFWLMFFVMLCCDLLELCFQLLASF
ncbi:hypothetical protein DLK06_21140 (plasmid) [Acinetobacter pittii]|nr:hypothetical protein DLK06_21140 [Acinetobacter pittii]KQE27306.1 hypothetical protein APD42_18415 [Acinetobacter nosocomialis]